MSKIKVSCPKCKKMIGPELSYNIFREIRLVIRCGNCNSIFTSVDGKIWVVVIDGNNEGLIGPD